MCENNSNLRSWSDVRKELFTPEEIAASDERVKELVQAKANYEDLKARGDDAIGDNALEYIDSLLTEEETAESNKRVEDIAELRNLTGPPHLDMTNWTDEQFAEEIEKGFRDIREGRSMPIEEFEEKLKREGRL